MNCTTCGRFMTDQGIELDPENLEDEVRRWWHCSNCKTDHPEHLYFKSELPTLGAEMVLRSYQ